jgi:hypothetical protein
LASRTRALAPGAAATPPELSPLPSTAAAAAGKSLSSASRLLGSLWNAASAPSLLVIPESVAALALIVGQQAIQNQKEAQQNLAQANEEVMQKEQEIQRAKTAKLVGRNTQIQHKSKTTQHKKQHNTPRNK